MKKLKAFIFGIVVIFALCATAFAATRTVTAELTYKDIKITLDGQQITPTDANGNTVEPFIIDGTTYLPIRGVASALGLDVQWDNATRTIILATPGHSDQNPATQTPQKQPVTQQNGEAYQITYQNSKIYRGSLGNVECYAIVEVQNTGSVDLYLKDATFNFEDKSGNLLATYGTMVSSDPEIIAPGEKGYFYCNAVSLSGNINESSDYTFVPNLKIQQAKNSIIRYDVSDLSMSEGKFIEPVDIIGRVTNSTTEDDSLVWIACILYRSDGTPIAACGTNVTNLKAGETQAFDLSAVYLSWLDLDYSEIASYKVYACKNQYQF